MNTLSFLERYEQLITTNDFENKFKRNIEKVCKFCSKTSSETTFLNIPHVIPELFGRNNYTSNDECDVCNKLFGYFETDLANFISPYQTLIGQKTKKKVPTFQSRKKEREQSTIIKHTKGRPHFYFGRNYSDFQYDYENKLMEVKIKKKKFKPINVYKGLVKIGLSLCPEKELINYSKTVGWLSQNNSVEGIIYDIPLTLIRTRFSNKYFKKPWATLYKRKQGIKDNMYEPRLCLIVFSGTLVFQLYIPFCKETENINPLKYKLVNEIYPAFAFDVNFPKDKREININMKELSIKEYNMNWYRKVEEDELITFTYSSIDKN